MKYEIVKFLNGKYAIRKRYFFKYLYKDLTRPGEWRDEMDSVYSDCCCKDTLEKVKQVYFLLVDKGTPIDIEKGEEIK